MAGMRAVLVLCVVAIAGAADNSTTTILTTTTTTTFQAKTATSTTTIQGCTNTDNGAENRWDLTCVEYANYSHWCTYGLDDDDFSSSNMCCACGGGSQADTTTTIETSSPESTTFVAPSFVGKLGIDVENTSFILDGSSNQADFELGVQRSIASAGNIADERMVSVTLATARRLHAVHRQLQTGTIQADYTVALPESFGSAAKSSTLSALKAVTAETFTSVLSAKLQTIMGVDAPRVVVSVIDVPTQDTSSDSTTASATESPASDATQKGAVASMYALVMAGLVASLLM